MSGLELAAARTRPASELSYIGGFSSAVVLFPKLSKLLNQENALSAPCSPWHPRGALHGSRNRRNAADRLDPSLLMSHYCLLHATHHADKR
jgi:hypothetical protein